VELRPYQQDALDAIVERMRPRNPDPHVLVSLPTGAGKTVIFATLAAQLDWMRFLIVAHRDELIEQAAAKVFAVTGQLPGIEKAASRASATDRVVIASVQTLAQPRRQIAGEPFDVLVIDEAHHAAPGNSYAALIEKIAPELTLGFTATPFRGQGQSLSFFTDCAYSTGIVDLIKQGYLSDVLIRTLPVRIDLRGVRSKAGDLAEGDLGKAVAPHLDALADLIAKDYADRKLLAFCPLRMTSELWSAKLAARGLAAAHVAGDSPDRKDVLQRFASNEIRFLSNAALLFEGYDQPDIDAILLLRPTRSPVIYSQMIGRGTRLAPGKDRLLVLDPAFVSERHSLAHAVNLANVPDDAQESHVLDYMTQGRSLAEAIDLAVSDAAKARARALEAELRRSAMRQGYEHSLTAPRPDQNAPQQRSWRFEQPTSKQLWRLRQMGVSLGAIRTKGDAWDAINRAMGL
jgi:superfamily II DNA or RNA helicase